MNKHSSIKTAGSLLERASELYDFGAALRGGAGTPIAAAQAPDKADVVPHAAVAASVRPPMPSAPVGCHRVTINRERLSAQNFIVPDGPVTGLSEEFRIVKRQLLLAARGGKGIDALPHGERILVCSANPNEGKTFCAINLAISMASEKDNRVLLVDADFAKPSVLSTLGIEKHRGFMDALADPACDAESLVLQTDIDGLSILPAGSQTNQDTEYLAASRTAEIIDQLTRNDPARIIIFDSPPALAASPASVLALHVGQTLMVVHADVTNDSALRDALGLLSGCEHVQLLLNRTKFSPTGRKFGNYYGYGAS
jgi:exopolysaccharide/PEP-CTERM locus tyrosine autokinase